MKSPIQSLYTVLILALGIACLALPPAARATLDPPPDGGYTNENTAEGIEALGSLQFGIDGGDHNTAVGFETLSANTTGDHNTGLGADTLAFNSIGNDNTAAGYLALFLNTTGSRNVALGTDALYSNLIGIDNTATGVNALFNNTGNYNTATGYQAMESNTTGTNNTADGLNTLNTNTTGSSNVASGAYALFNNTTGANNTAIGFDALYQNTIANSNTAVGLGALQSNTTGSGNIALGLNAGFNLTTGSNNIDIGSNGVAGDSARIRIGTKPTHKNTFIAGIFGVPVPTGVAVLIDNTGHLGTTTSSARFKENIRPMDKASEAILALQPVTFQYKHEFDQEGIPQFGLVAEEVEKVSPDLVARDDEGKPYTVRYEAVNAMLLNEFLKEHRKVEEQATAIAQQRNDFQASITKLEATLTEEQAEIKALTAILKEQAAQTQKVSAQLAIDKSSARVTRNNP